jgi:N-acetylmuramoyl-L-alanine amidase
MNGLRVVIDPVGGLYLDERFNEWRFQRAEALGLQGDLIVIDVAAHLFDILQTVGVEVFATRNLRKSRNILGESGRMAFMESAHVFLRSHKIPPSVRERRDNARLPESVWKDGATNKERDRNARTNFAKHVHADLIVVIDATNYATDDGIEMGHNAIGQAQAIADRILNEVANRTRRKTVGTRELLDEEKLYAESGIPTVIVNCGSTFDHFTSSNLRQSWYRNCISLGAFAGLWKHYSSIPAAVPTPVL